MASSQAKKNQPKRKKRKEPVGLWVALGVLLLAGAGAYFYYQPPASLSKPYTSAQIKMGEGLFSQNCASCHGNEGTGADKNNPGGGSASNGMSIAPALNGTAHSWHHPTEMIFNKIKNGASDPKTSTMPAFKDRFSDEEIVAVLHYIKYSLWPESIQIRHAAGGKHTMN